MKVTVDTNVLIRSAVRDDVAQAVAADKVLKEASLIAVSLPCLCEFIWVLSRSYKFPPTKIATAIRTLLEAENVVTDRPAVNAGLRELDAGGDFADGIMAYEGKRLGGETFTSFDRKAVSHLAARGEATQLLTG